MDNTMKQTLIEILTKLQAVQVLEYYDKNLLANMKSVSEQKQAMLANALEILEKHELDPAKDGK